MSRKFKHPESGHWLTSGNNHKMANRNRNIQNSAKFAVEEQWELLRLIAEVFAVGVTRARFWTADIGQGSSSDFDYIELQNVYEAL
jgi:hypothetical protein